MPVRHPLACVLAHDAHHTTQPDRGPIPVLSHGRLIGHLDQFTWHHHLLIGEGTVHIPEETVSFARRPLAVHQHTPQEPITSVEIDPANPTFLATAVTGLSLDPDRPWSRYTAQHIGTPYYPYAPVCLTVSEPKPTREEEALIALYAHYRLTLGHPDTWTDEHLASLGQPSTHPTANVLARPANAEPDPLRLKRHGEDHWTSARTSWSVPQHAPPSTRARQSLAQVLDRAEKADGTYTYWDLYRTARSALHLQHT